MHFVYFLVFSTLLVATLGDCGCLKCSRHLRIISPPGAPVTVIERGDACVCPKPFPYNIEFPIPPAPRPRKDYGYKVKEVKYVQPCDPQLGQHGYRVDIPYIPGPKPHIPHEGVAKVDRIVVPARDECVPPKANCCNDPVIEYILPACASQCCDCPYVYPSCYRKKRDLYQDTLAAPTNIDWSGIFGPKTARSLSTKKPWMKRAQIPALSTSKRHDVFGRYKNYMDAKYNTPARKVVQEKPLRFNIPLTLKDNHFFPSTNIKTKRKIQSSNPFLEYPIKIDTQSDRGGKSIRSKALTRLLKKSGKFADVENVKINFEPPTRYHEKIKTKNQFGARKKRSVTLKDASNRIIRDHIQSGRQFREDFGKSFVDNLGIKNRFSMPNKKDQVSYLLDTPIRIADHLNRMKEYIGPMMQSVPKVLDTSRNYVKDFGKRFGRGTVEVFKDLIGNVRGLPKMMLSSVLSPYRRHKRNIVKGDTSRIVGGDFEENNLEEMPKLELMDHYIRVNRLDDPAIDTQSFFDGTKQTKKDFASNISYRIVQNEVNNILKRIKQFNDYGINMEEQIFRDISKLQFQKDSFTAILNDIVSKGTQNDPDMKIILMKMIQKVLSSKQDLTRRIGEILESKRSFNVGDGLVKKLVILEKLHWVLTKLIEDLAGDINNILADMEYLDQLDVVQEKTASEIRNMLKRNRDFEMKKEIMILDRLKGILRCKNQEESKSKIDQVAQTLWQMNYCKKLLKNTISEMNHNIKNDLTSTREIKIIFDLEKGLELCQNRLFDLFQSVS